MRYLIIPTLLVYQRNCLVQCPWAVWLLKHGKFCFHHQLPYRICPFSTVCVHKQILRCVCTYLYNSMYVHIPM